MINVNLQARRMAAQDHDQVANFIFYESNHHRHLDWHSPLERVNSSNCWVLSEDGRIIAVLACPEDPPHVAWISFFGHHHKMQAHEAWNALWETARAELAYTNSQLIVASIAMKQWFQSVLLSSGFEVRQNIVLLELLNENIRSLSAPQGFRIRPMFDADIPAVAKVDLAAFGLFWHNTAGTLRQARLQCASATIAEDGSGVIGYQLSTKSLLGAHLARLGVRPEAQGRGVGSSLVGNLIQTLGGSQLNRLSVNTQADNNASLALYQKMGFVRTGESFPVLVYPMDAGA
jgi:ribosomal protein S18 acetylase RimI-like enzyme